MRNLLPIADVLGPGHLAYAGRDEFRPDASARVETLPGDHADIQRLLHSADPDEAEESGIAGIASPAFVIRHNGKVVAVSGYSVWLAMVAHVCVLTDSRYRSKGLARAVASAAVEHALYAGLLAQWRARPAASRRVAEVLGFMPLGAQLSVQISRIHA